jgi:hypothetical protein
MILVFTVHMSLSKSHLPEGTDKEYDCTYGPTSVSIKFYTKSGRPHLDH